MTTAQQAILDALNHLVLSRPYDAFGVKQLVAEAGVSRSTFYEHYPNKDAVLREAVTPVLQSLVNLATAESSTADITAFLDHIGRNQRSARAVLLGPAGQQIANILSDLIEERLRSLPRRSEHNHTRLFAAQLAEAQLAPIRQWLDAPSQFTQHDVATMIERTSRAMIDAWAGTP